MNKIKFNKPFYDVGEIENLRKYLLGGVDFRQTVAGHLKRATGAVKVIPTAGAAAAMDAYFAAMNFPSGGEVAMPSFTFPSAANSVVNAGLRPVFTDIDQRTLVMDQGCLKEGLSKRTVCIMPVHYGGASMDMDSLMEISLEYGIPVFEDAALSYGAFYKGRHLGTIGDAGALSFHATKNISGDGGGALLLNGMNVDDAFEEILADGTDRPAFNRGEVAAYTWRRAGRGGAMTGLTAAVLAAQLEKEDDIRRRRKIVWDAYYSGLKKLAGSGVFELPSIPPYNTNNYHVFHLGFKDRKARDVVAGELAAAGVEAFIHYMPLHSSSMGASLGYRRGDLPVTESAASGLLRLPMHAWLDSGDVDGICKLIARAVAHV
ncbi:MAG: DegT/DnrJ/EryC1/StrS family aminotransferase [Clostridia bacterium]|nr:DegT/DnrJ/EryC1/StrS family aminotransferase [Clostridia bacterium]